MTPTSVGLVLVEGQDADGATMDRNTFAVADGPIQSSEQATAAVLRTEAMAATRGLRLHSIGVTWSEDADMQASLLMKSLTDSGFDNVVAIRMPEATEALARGIAEVLGYATTAVCVIEPDSVITLVVNTSDGAVQTAFNHSIDSDQALISWLSTVFTRADWAPEALVIVGSADGCGSIPNGLEDALSVPVFAPEEAKLALARGAALASAQSTDMPLHLYEDQFRDGHAVTDSGRHRVPGSAPQRRRSPSRAVPVAMLAAGLVTFVVSVSIAISLQLSPTREARPGPVPAANTERPVAVRPSPPAMPPPVVAVPSPVVEAALPPPPPESPPPVYDEQPVAIADVPAEAPSADQLPAADPSAPSADVPVVDPGVAAPPADTPPIAGTPLPPNAAPPYVAPVPTKKPGILTRIKERLTPGNDN
ncbi:MAG: hypothetical protein ABW001_04465 [Mycobacterium sp.]